MNDRHEFFESPLRNADPDIEHAINDECSRQRSGIELIASENIVSRAVLEAQGSVLTNKYAEGYPGRRYYGGCTHVDRIETLAIERAKTLFSCEYANVQPVSGSQANQAVFLALLRPGDIFMGMDLSAGGHLTHGARVNLSGKWFNCVSYGVDRQTHRIDMDALQRTAEACKPKLIVAGGSAYPRAPDFQRFREIADSVGALLLVDMAHFAGLVAGGVHPNPIPFADVVTSTTHKTLRGARGGLILSRDDRYAKKLNSAIFPGLQGGPLMHIIAGKAVAFGQALKPAFKTYSKAVVNNAQRLSDRLTERGFDIVSGGTDTHIVLVDLTRKGVTGANTDTYLESIDIACNKNGIPFDTLKPTVTSGIRLGTAAATTRGFGTVEFEKTADLIADAVDALAKSPEEADRRRQELKKCVHTLTANFPMYEYLDHVTTT